MVRLIKIHEIDEFSDIKSIPDRSITDTIISNIKQLDEEQEMEPLIRQILYDPNETPHGPTEIADILTTHLHLRGSKRLSAFVLKGKSFKRVASISVSHQFDKVRQIPGLGLMVFGAVGNIQDDAKRDFVQHAQDAGCDYLIINCHDLSRLLIAYEKVCPKDGTPYDNTGTCKNGHELDKGIKLEMQVRERSRYTIIGPKDLSYIGAKRYSATVLLDRRYPKDVIRMIIQEVTQKLKNSNHYRSKKIEAQWGKTPTHVVWIFVACDLEDIQSVNWICQTEWIDLSLPMDMRPASLNGNEKLGDINILWNDEYKPRKEFLESQTVTKEVLLRQIEPILIEMLELGKRAIEYFQKYQSGKIPEGVFISKMQEMEPRVSELYHESGNLPLPPPDCGDYDQACQCIFTDTYNMFIYYSKTELGNWTKGNKDWLMQNTIKRFNAYLKTVEYEQSKLC